MDETTISDIKQRVQRWEKATKTNPNTSERNWIFAVNIDDVNLLLVEIEHLQKQVESLQKNLQIERDRYCDCMQQLNFSGDIENF